MENYIGSQQAIEVEYSKQIYEEMAKEYYKEQEEEYYKYLKSLI